MKVKSIKLNAILNVIRSCLSIVFPLITTPYVSRVLGTEGVGKISYVKSIVGYFSMFAMLGVSTYAVREGAKKKTNKLELNEFVSEVFSINVIFTIISCICLGMMVLLINQFHSYQLLFLVFGHLIIFQTFSIEWINTIFEDFLYITIRTIVIFIIQLILIFALVNDESDYYLYAIIQVISYIVICVSNWTYCRKYIHIRIGRLSNFSKHIKPLLILFSNAIMISIYVNFDMTMLGWYKDDNAVGLYSISVKIYSVIKALIVAIYTVTIPRLAKLYGQNDKISFRNIYSNLWSYITLILLPATTGIICLSRDIINLMGGDKFQEASVSLQILGGALTFAIFGGLVTACLNVTIGREKENLKATIISAMINFTLNLFFIPHIGINGAAITTLLSEAFVFLFCFLRLPEKESFFSKKDIIINLMHAILGSVLVVVISFGINYLSSFYIVRIISTIILSVISYSVMLIILKNNVFLAEFSKIKKRFIR